MASRTDRQALAEIYTILYEDHYDRDGVRYNSEQVIHRIGKALEKTGIKRSVERLLYSRAKRKR